MKEQVFLKKLGKQIKLIREEQRISQAELARRCFKEKQHLSQIENAKINPTVFTLYHISQALKIPLSRLMEFDTYTTKSDQDK